jgi:hypothetical protein
MGASTSHNAMDFHGQLQGYHITILAAALNVRRRPSTGPVSQNELCNSDMERTTPLTTETHKTTTWSWNSPALSHSVHYSQTSHIIVYILIWREWAGTCLTETLRLMFTGSESSVFWVFYLHTHLHVSMLPYSPLFRECGTYQRLSTHVPQCESNVT